MEVSFRPVDVSPSRLRVLGVGSLRHWQAGLLLTGSRRILRHKSVRCHRLGAYSLRSLDATRFRACSEQPAYSTIRSLTLQRSPVRSFFRTSFPVPSATVL